MKKTQKLNKQILRVVVSIFLTVLLITLSIVIYTTVKSGKNNAEQYGINNMELAAEKIRQAIISKQIELNIIKNELETKINNRFLFEHDRDKLNGVLKEYVDNHENIYGCFAIFEKNAFDELDDEYLDHEIYGKDNGRYKIWMTKDGVFPITGDELEYYQKPKKTKQLHFTNPYNFVQKKLKKSLVTLSIPIIQNDIFIGAIGLDFDLIGLQSLTKNIVLYDGHGTFGVIDSEGNFLSHNQTQSLIGKNITDLLPEPELRIQKLDKAEIDLFGDKSYGYISYPLQFFDHITPWQVHSKVAHKIVFKNLLNSLILILVVSFLCIVSGIFALNKMIKKNIDPIIKLSKYSDIAARGDLSQTFEIESNNEIGIMATAVKQMVHSLKIFVSEMQNGAEYISSASTQLQGSSEQMSSNVNEQASITEEISSNMEEMSASVQETAAKSHEMNENAKHIDGTMQKLITGVESATDLQIEINDLVREIDDVARQIKILSLNASVEAARAGEFGKGFTVVAKEIQRLSEKTTAASKVINDKSDISKEESIQATKIVKMMLPAVNLLSRNTEKIMLANEEQAENIGQVSSSTNVMNNGTQEIAANAEELASTVEELNNQAKQLNELANKYIV